MLDLIIDWCNSRKIKYDNKLVNDISIDIVHKLLIYNIVTDFANIKDDIGIVSYYYGLYYWNKKNYEQMIKYYIISIEHKNYSAMFRLGVHYRKLKDYENMIKYYLMTIDGKCSDAMHNLGWYYETIEDYENAVKYYLLAIDFDKSSDSMNNLGIYYDTIGDHDNMFKYYLMAIEQNNNIAMANLALYYENIGDYENMFKYCLMAIDNGHLYSKDDVNILLKVQFNDEFARKNLHKLNNKHKKTYLRHMVNNMIKRCMTDICIICKEEKINLIKLSCNHILCRSCLINWYSKHVDNCVHCQQLIDWSSISVAK